MKKLILVLACLLAVSEINAQLTAPDSGSMLPLNGATGVDLDVILSWGPALGGPVKRYHAQLSSDSAFASPVALTCYGTTAQTNQLLFGQKYFWRTRAEDMSGGFSPYTPIRSFTTFIDGFVLAEPALPSTPGSSKFLEVEFGWNSVSGVLAYEFQMDEDSLFNTPLIRNVSHPNNSTIVKDLSFNSTYYYRLRASHSFDITNWSPVKSFQTISTITQAIPTNGGSGITPDFEVQCNNTVGVVEYRFELDTSPAFDPASVFFIAGTAFDKDFIDPAPVAFTAKKMKYATTYYWRVRGLNSASISAWSTHRTFNTIANPTLGLPLDGNTDVPDEAVFSWQHIRGTESYNLQIDVDTTFSNPSIYVIQSDTVQSDSVRRTVVFTDFTKTYYWRVQAEHSKGISDWSEHRTFNVRPVGVTAFSDEKGLSVTPNPADDEVAIQVKGVRPGAFSLEMYDVLGNRFDRVNRLNWDVNGRAVLDLSDLNAGLYFLVLRSDRTSVTRKLIVR